MLHSLNSTVTRGSMPHTHSFSILHSVLKQIITHRHTQSYMPFASVT